MVRRRWWLVAGAAIILATAVRCGSSGGETPVPDTGTPDVGVSDDTGADTASPEDVPTAVDGAPDGGDVVAPPGLDLDAAARGFRLYYRERVERAIVAYQRILLSGDTLFGTTIGKIAVARTGDEIEIVPGPNDNNRIGISVWTTWHAYRIFRTRTLALALVRMFDGLVFFEAVSGHPGVTSRMVYPGWTRTVDGIAGTVTRTRAGAPAEYPVIGDPELEPEILATFYEGVRVTYREEPPDILLEYMPAAEVGPYAATYSFSMLPRYLRVSDCCTSLMRTPAPYAWEGAFWGNHNSRDNFPDLTLGYLTAMEAMDDESADPDLRAAAQRAFAAGQRIGDLVQANDGRLMTVDEHNPYDTLIVAGAVRPDGETEAEDLGSLSDCQMAYLARTISSDGLTTPLPDLPLPGALDDLIGDTLGIDCPTAGTERVCHSMEEAYCGYDWDNIGEAELLGHTLLEILEQIEAGSPGSAEQLAGSFQDDFYEKTLALLGLVYYAQMRGDEDLLAEARAALRGMTDLMRTFADLLYAQTKPARQQERRYEAALFDGAAGLETISEDFAEFARAESAIGRIEALLDPPEATPRPLLTDEEIRALVDARLSGLSNSVKQRYAEAYGDTPPFRRAGEGYEARGYPEEEIPWHAVERQRHDVVGGIRLLHALPLCNTDPSALDCTWARLGCARPDLNADGAVDEADQSLFDTAATEHAGATCDEEDGWCDGADLDHSGLVDDADTAFMAAAQGCYYDAS